MDKPSLLSPHHNLLRALACTIVPEAAHLTESHWREFNRLLATALGDRPPAMQRRLLLFLRFVEWLPVLRYGRRFSSLDAARRANFLSYLERHSIALIRLGFWGLRTLVLLGYYGQPEIARQIGYTPEPRGWEARR